MQLIGKSSISNLAVILGIILPWEDQYSCIRLKLTFREFGYTWLISFSCFDKGGGGGGGRGATFVTASSRKYAYIILTSLKPTFL